MRLMSFSMTTEAYRNRTKTVTRRLGWRNLKPGDVLMGVEKCRGIPKGGKVVRMHPLRVVSVWREPLGILTTMPFKQAHDEVIREGFPDLTPTQFVEMFCRHNKVTPDTPVTRIEFEHLPAAWRCVKCGKPWDEGTVMARAFIRDNPSCDCGGLIVPDEGAP
jgi:hypothetical protein